MKRDKFDIAMSDLVRGRANWTCERCHTPYPEGHRRGLECSHIFGRRRHSVRWFPDNCLSLCTGCHRHVSSYPEEHRELAISILGMDRYAALKLKAAETRKWTKLEKDEMYFRMKMELKRMQALRDGGETGRIEFIT